MNVKKITTGKRVTIRAVGNRTMYAPRRRDRPGGADHRDRAGRIRRVLTERPGGAGEQVERCELNRTEAVLYVVAEDS